MADIEGAKSHPVLFQQAMDLNHLPIPYEGIALPDELVCMYPATVCANFNADKSPLGLAEFTILVYPVAVIGDS